MAEHASLGKRNSEGKRPAPDSNVPARTASPRARHIVGPAAMLALQVTEMSSRGDVLERNADQLASSMLSSSPPRVEGDAARRRTASPSTRSIVPRAALMGGALSSGSRPLDDRSRAYFEPRLGLDLSAVRIHADEQAPASPGAVDALAFSLGTDIVFAGHSQHPREGPGGWLLAHELAHIAQRHWSGDISSTRVLGRYEAGEHAQTGDAARVVTISGVKLNEGDLVALGDFYEKPEDIYKAPAAELQKLVDLIERDKKAYLGVGGVKPVSNAEWADATKGRPVSQQYLELAKRNDPHFAPRASGQPGGQGDHKAAWRQHHSDALSKTLESTASGKTGVPEEAVVLNGFAAHFLTDAFAAGHLVNKDDAMQKAQAMWTTQKFDGWYFKESDFTRKVAAQVLADRGVAATMSTKELKMVVWDDVTPDRFSEFIYQMASTKPGLFFNAFGRLIHDKLNESIKDPKSSVEVTNNRGDTWTLSGDETLARSPESLRIMREAVAMSYRNLEAVAKLNTTPPSFEPYFNAVWDYTPRPTPAGKKAIDDVVSTYTDPKDARTVDAFAKLAIVQIDTLVSELTAQGYLRDKPSRSPAGTKLPDGTYVPGQMPGGAYIDKYGNVTVPAGR
jgi:hypothetical protein